LNAGQSKQLKEQMDLILSLQKELKELKEKMK